MDRRAAFNHQSNRMDIAKMLNPLVLAKDPVTKRPAGLVYSYSLSQARKVKAVSKLDIFSDGSNESSDEAEEDLTLQRKTRKRKKPYQAYQIGPYSRPLKKMAPAIVPPNPVGPHPSYIHVAQVYLFQQQLQSQLVAIGTNPTREDNFRLQGVQWINDVRAALQL